MNEQIKTLNGKKILSDSNICRNAESRNAASPEKKMVKIQGILTSRIETKQERDTKQTYHYGFFKIPNQEPEIPVIFKDEEGPYKPTIPKGSQVLLEGNWAKSNGSRPSFTATQYQILKDPPEINIKSLRETIHSLLTLSLKEKSQWSQTTDFLFNKLK